MSHVTEATVGIEHVTPELLAIALDALASCLPNGVVVNDSIPLDWKNKTDNSRWKDWGKCRHVLKWKGFERGVGFNINERGELTYMTDWFEHENEVKQTVERTKEAYALAASVLLLKKKLGMKAKIKELNGQLVVTGVR